MKKKYLFIIALLVSSIFSYGQCTVPDETKPSISCIGNQIKSADAGKCYYTTVGTEFNPTASDDNCVVISVTNDFNSTSTLDGAQIPNGTTITWTVTDAAGLTTDCSFYVTVTDTTKPVFTLSPASLTIECNTSILPAATNGSATATDNCDTPTIAYSDVVVNGTGNNKTITRTWTATDANSNVSSYVQTITVTDTTKPVFTLSPASLTIECNTSILPAATNGSATATDNCDTPTIAYSDVVVNGTGNNKTITRTWTATDANSNVSSYVQTITVTDTTKPVFTLSPASLTIECNTSISPAATNGSATATDNCDTPTIAYSDVVVNGTGNNKTITRTWTATDANSNVSSYVQTITVTDTTKPVFTLSPASLTIECNTSILPAATNGSATATDNCDTPTIAYSDVVVNGTGNNKTITRTWTATDANSNVSSYVQTITVTDTTKPVFTLSPASLTIECNTSILPAATNGSATATDNCDTPTIAYSDVVVNGTGNNKTITRTWTATDANSNVSSYVQTITVTDTTKPVFTLSPASLTIECNTSILPAATNGSATATDNCDTPTIAYSDVVVNGTGNNKTITRTWTATDANSNVSSYVQTITVTDTTKPVFTLSPASLTIECNTSILPAATNGSATATDNCDTPTIAYSDVVVNGTGNNKTITRTWTATDANSNVSSYVQTITVTDTTKPVFTLSPASLTIECNTSISPAATNGSATATDNCDTPTIAYSDVVVNGTGNNKTITRTWTATDANSNVSSYVQTITVTDTTKPVFTLSPASLTIECNTSILPAATNGSATATDNCDTPTIAYSDVVVNGTGNNKTITRTWTATDANSNVSSYVQTITVTDTTKPVFTLSPASLTIECNTSILPAATNGSATATDNCDTPTIAYSDVVVNGTGNNKTITRTWTATDANSNVSSYVQTITVTDTTKPVFTLSPASLTIECNTSILPAATNGSATATDNCDTPTIAYSDVVVNGTGNNKTITRTWTATDANSNVSSYVQTITVTDTTKPVFTLSPASLTIECNTSILPAATNGSATATDNCDTPTIAYSDVVVNGTGNNKTITRTWTATDANSNVSSYVQTITVTDTTKPVFTLSPASLTIECNTSILPAATNGSATATDNCDTPTIAYSDVVVNGTGNNKTITRTWTATDANSNVSSYVQTITVTDTTKPVFTLSPASLTIECNTSISPAATNGSATATDNCDTPTIAYSDVVVNGTGNNKTITRTWTATDANSNVSSYVQTITVTDTTKPVFTLSPASLTIECNTSILPAATNGSATATDNCDTPTIAYSDVVVNGTGNNKTITRTWTATDANSNVSSYVQTITVTDTTKPVFTLSPASLTIECNTSILPAATNGSATATDNCDTPTIAYSDVVVNGTGNNKTITRTWTATDANSNVSSYVQTITVTDTTKPVFTLSPASLTIECNTSILPAATNGSATATDNCDTPTIAYSDVVVNGTGNNKTITRTWTATDANSNVSSYVQTITVTDTTKPVFTLSPASLTIECNTSILPAATNGSATATDNCDTPTIAYSDVVVNGTGNNKTITRTWTATDANSNVSSYVQTITVTDTTKPTITCPGTATANTNSDGTGNCTTTVSLGTPTATDNCTTTGSFTFIAKVGGTTINPVTYLFGKGTSTVVWTAIDQAGNISASCNQTVIVTDNENPIITSCPGNKTANTSANGTGDCTTTVNLGSPTATDNCGTISITAKIGSTIIDPATHLFVIGITTVTWVATDNSGLTATCNQIVEIIDNENPTISCPSDQNVFFNTNCGFTLLDYTTFASTSDNCDNNLTITQSPAPGTIITGITTVTLTAKDYSNRTSSCTFKVIPTDNIKPVAVCKNYTAYLTANGTVTVAASNLNNGSSDNCGIVNMTISPNSFNCADIGTKTVTFTVYDNGGNSDSCQAEITIVDNTPPTMLCKNFVVVVDAITRVATIKASDVDNGTNDACGIASLSVSPSEFPESANVYTTTTVLTAVDIHGNSNTCTATITVEPPKNQFTYLTGQIINPVPDNQQPPAALIEATACPGGITVPKDVHFTIQAIGSYDLQASDIENWEYSNDNGETWIVLSGTAGLLEYTLTGLLSDTFVRLRIRDSVDPNLIKTSAEAYVRFLPPDERPIIISHTALDICLGDSVTVIAESFFDQPNGQFGEGGEFNYAQPDGWRVNKKDGFFPASGDNGNEESWKETNSNNNATFSGINYDTTDNTKFAVAHGAGNTSALGNYTSLETPVFSTIGMTASEAILNFKTSYYFCNGGYGEIWLSFDSGNTYTVQLSTNEPFDFDSRDGVTTTGVKLAKGPGNKCIGRTDPRMMPATVSLGAYAGLSGLRVMFKFTGSTSSCGTVSSSNIPNPDNVNCGTGNALASGWAIDAVGFNFAGVDDELEWTDENGTVIARGTTAIVTPVTPGVREYGVTTLVNGCRTNNNDGTNFININTSLAYAGEDYMPLTSNCGDNTLKLNAYDNRITAVENYDKGAWKSNLYVVPNITMGNINYKGTGVTGAWSIISSSSSSCGSSATFSSTTDPNAIFTADPGSYSLRWTLINGCYDDVDVTVIDCKTVDFDGVNDFVTFKNNYNLNNDFSIQVWVKPNSVSNTSTVFSRKNAANNTTGYDLSIVNGQIKFNWYNGSGSGSVTSGAYTINTSRWYHLAVTFNGSTYKLYVDGLELGSVNGTAPALTAINVEAILGAMYQVSPSVPTNYFNGWVDELEIWSKALSVENIRQMMNQEIVALGPDVGGVVIPTKIYGADSDLDGAEDVELVWNDLIGYYRMSVVCGDLSAYKGVSGRLRNINSSEQQTAPIPYTTRVNDQTWDTDNTWTNFNVWDVPNSLGINTKPIDWNIVVTSHKVTSDTRDITLLGLIVMSNELIITNSGVQDENNSGHLLWLTKYLKLDGKIDLIGESQLLQKRHGYYDTPGGNFITSQFNESVFENSSTGYIERDQQGKQNSYNYNYWSSPVSKRGGANNSNYTVSDVLRGGTVSSSPKIINFGDGAYFADGDFISPIKISNRWIWSYKSLTPDSNSDWDNYYQWQYKANTGLIGVAEGFTMKGTGGVYSVEKLQNYVFTGKPNSGTISLFLAIYQTYLVGNPYPSALDANEFIKDNIKDCFDCRGSQNSFGGALYFWDHFGLSNSHILAEYEGGYATYTLTGGVPGINDSSLTLNDGTSGVKTPGRYIPVGQGFFIDGDLDLEVSGTGVTTTVGGGTITFKNSQRIFVRETGSPVNSIFMKKNSAKSSLSEDQGTENDFRLKIRLGFDSTVGAHRQLLLGANSNTSNKFDLGYDAQMFDTNDNDMYWELGDIQLVIQSVQNFNDDQIIPFGLSVANEGKSIIKIDALENIPNTLEIYLHDNVTGIYHDIKNNDYPISLPIGEYNNRFSLQFVNKLYNVGKTALDDGIYVYYTNNNEMLNIKNNFIDTTVEKVYLFNVLGQNLANWDIDDIKQNNIQIPIKNVSTGVYIVKLKTTKGELSSKILIP